MVKIVLPETWAGVAEPLRALMVEVERDAHADSTTPAGPRGGVGAVGAVGNAIRVAVRARIGIGC